MPIQPFEKRDLAGVAVKLIRSLKVKGELSHGGMVYDALKGFCAYIALSYFFMPVLMRGKRVFAVVYMIGLKTVYTYYTVKLIYHAVKISDYVIARIVYVTGVKAHAELFGKLAPVDYASYFFK